MKRALTHMAVAAFFFSVMAIGVKMVPRLPVVEVVFFRALVALILSYGFIRRRKISPWGTHRSLLIMRGVFGTMALLAYFTTLHSLTLATATVLQYLSPIFTAVVAAFAVGERIRLPHWACFALSFAGVIVIKGFDPSVGWHILAIGTLGALASGFAYNCIARLRTTEDPQVIIFYFPLVTVPVMTPFVWQAWISPTPREWATLLFIGVFVQTAQYFMTLSYQFGRPAAVSIASYIGVLFALLWDVAIFSAKPSQGVLLGIAMVLAGVVISALLNSVETKKSPQPL